MSARPSQISTVMKSQDSKGVLNYQMHRFREGRSWAERIGSDYEAANGTK